MSKGTQGNRIVVNESTASEFEKKQKGQQSVSECLKVIHVPSDIYALSNYIR